MKKILLVIAIVAVSCKKQSNCYLCQIKNGYDLIRVETRCTPQPGTIIVKDSAGNNLTVICRLKN